MFVVPNEISDFLKQLSLPKGPIVVGVSGGADSLYLTHLMASWCKKTKRQLLTVTVNHNLRPEAEKEALWVHKQLAKHNISHDILVWEGPKPKTRLEERARDKRYELLLDFCHKHKAASLFLAHHQQDQAETFWTRLARGSGLDGLCGMAPVSQRTDILIVRPLLNTPKEAILKTLKKHRIKWVEDPMNQDTLYERVRWRQAQAQLDKMGLEAAFITKATKRLQRAKEALTFYTQEFLTHHLKKSPLGFVQMDEAAFKKLPEEVRIRALIHILKLFHQKEKIISLESVENLALKMPQHATLTGCQWVISHHQIFVAPELKYLGKTPLKANTKTTWGALTVWTNKAFCAEAQAPTPRLDKIPYLIQRTFLKAPKGYRIVLCSQKELEKKVKLDYKENTVVIQFNASKEE